MKRQNGFSLVSAVFLLVVVASFAAYMVTISGTQRQTSTLSILGNRARAAAGSGLEWASENVLSNDACFASPSTFVLTGGAADGFTVDATCAATSYSEGPATYNVFRLTVTGRRGTPGQPGYVTSTFNARVTTAP